MTLKKPLLSFCIPTYNRADMIVKCVKNILKYKGDEIEVVVSNNCSEDDTLEKLEQLKDERLKVHSNEINLGYSMNLIKVLEKTNGKYCFTLSDEDVIIIEKIPQMLKMLLTEKYDLILTSVKKSNIHNQNEKKLPKSTLKNKVKQLLRYLYYRQNMSNYYIYYRKNELNKVETLKKIFARTYLSGIIMKREHINFTQLLSIDNNYFDFYPQIFVMLMVNEKGITYFNKEANSIMNSVPLTSHIMTEGKKTGKKHYPHPESRYDQMKNRIKWLEELNLSGDEKRLLTLYLFKVFLSSSEHGYMEYTSEDEKKVSTEDFKKIAKKLLDVAKNNLQKTNVINEYDEYVIKLARKFLDKILINKSNILN